MIAPRITETELGTTEHYATATFGKILAIPQVDAGLLYKTYEAHPRPADRLDRLIRIRAEAEGRTRQRIDEEFAWPLSHVVTEEGATAGVVIPKAPDRFWATLSTGPPRIRDMNYLLYERRAARAGVTPPSAADRFRILSAFANSLSLALSLGLIHEDLSPTNVLWTTDPAPAVYLLDCDSLTPVDAPPDGPLILSPEWSDPRVSDKVIARPDPHSVPYVFALHVIRALCGPSWRPPIQAAGAGSIPDAPGVPAEVMAMIRRSLDTAHLRPSMAEWISVLDEAATHASQEPRAPVEVRGGVRDQQLGRRSLSYSMRERLAILAGTLAGALLAVFVLWLSVVR